MKKNLFKTEPNNLFIFICGLLSLFFTLTLPSTALAYSNLYLDPAEHSYPIENIFTISVKVDTNGSAVNYAQGTLIFDNTRLAVVSLDTFGGDFNANMPLDTNFSNTNGIIHFGCGYVTPGTDDKHPNLGYTGNGGIVIKINFRGIALGTGHVNFDITNDQLPVRVFLNSGNTDDFVSAPSGQSTATGGAYTILPYCTANPSSANINTSIQFQSIPSTNLGSHIYSWAWSGSCTSNSPTCVKSFDNTGSKTPKLTVSEPSTGESWTPINNCPANIGVPGLNVSCNNPIDSADVGDPVTFNATASGGNGLYSYSWLNCGNAGNSSICTTSFDSPGLKTVTVTVNGSSSANCNVYINKICPAIVPKECETTPIIIETVDIIPTVKKIIETPAGSVAAKIISTAGVVAAGAALAFASPFTLPELFLLPMRLLSLLMIAFGLKKRNPPWGIVYDSVTKQPLDPAYVILKDLDGRDISSAITDLDGRYGFLAEPGIYKMTANKTNYLFPSQKLAGKTRDELYDNLYFGDTVEIKRDEVITRNIPLDPLKFDWNEFVKQNRSLTKFYSKWDLLLREISELMYYIGFIVAIIAFFVAPYPYNTIILGLYLLLLVLRILGIRPKPYGSVINKATDMPLAFAILRVTDPSTNVEISHRVTDKFGRYFCLVPKGKYYVKIESKNNDGSYSLVHTSQIIDASDNGIIKNKFKI